MSYVNFNEKLLGLQGVEITDIKEFDRNLEIHIIQRGRVGRCPHCDTLCGTIHDYRTQRIKDLPAFGKNVTLVFRKRRLHCHHCRKHFYQKNSFLPKYHRMTNRLAWHVLELLRDVRSFSSIARELNLSISTVIRIFDLVGYAPPKTLPRVIAIDEFKGNTRREKYQCIITDPENHKVLDILPKRYEYHLGGYFREYSKAEREKVELFVSDMWKPFQNTACSYFPNATRVIDKYHWARQMTWAFENVRKQEQKKFRKDYRRYFKHSRQLLLKRFDYLPLEKQQQVLVMLDTSVALSRSHFYKERFQEIVALSNADEKREMFKHWVDYTEASDLPQFKRCTNTYRHWMTEILNSMDTPITNGFTEGCNNKIKVLKRNAYGYRNFERFRNRILHIFSEQKPSKQQTDVAPSCLHYV